MKAIIKGRRVAFDSQCNEKLKIALAMHKEKYIYLGSSKMVLIDNKQFKCNKERHFFKLK